MDIDTALLLSEAQTLGNASATPEQRRAAAEVILRELAPHVVAALDDRPVAAGFVVLALDALDKAERGFTVGEIASILGGAARVLGLARAQEDRPRAARPSLAGILERAKARQPAGS